MNCYEHREAPAIATCRVCSVGLCGACAIPSERGFVCSDICHSRAETIDKMLDAQGVALRRRGNWFVLPAFIIVVGILLVGEKAIFHTPSNTIKVVIGIILLVIGLANALNGIYLIKNTRTNKRNGA